MMIMSDAPLVSIIVPCYNQAMYLAEAIASALAQDYPEIEIIVVDDGSTDHSASIARRYGGKVVLLQQDNKGLSGARNAGIQIASGEFVLCLDADDRIVPSFCTSTAPVLSQNPKVGIVATGWRFFGEVNYIVYPRAVSLVEQLATNPISCSALFRRSDWEIVGGFDEDMRNGFEDWDFWIRLRKLGRELAVVPEVLFEYRRKKLSMVTESLERSEMPLKMLQQKHADLYCKHFDEIHRILYGLYHRVRSVDRVQPSRGNGWRARVPVRLKYLAKAVLPNAIMRAITSR